MQTVIMFFVGLFRCFLGDASKTIIRSWILRRKKMGPDLMLFTYF